MRITQLLIFAIYSIIQIYPTEIFDSRGIDIDKRNISFVWNFPSMSCYKNYHNFSFPLHQYNIQHNEGHNFVGEKIAVFYEYNFGALPYYRNRSATEPVNGGLPQYINMIEHLSKFRDRIQYELPKDFDGVGIIDIEEWRPLYRLNWKDKNVYKKKSQEKVRNDAKIAGIKLTKAEIEERAEKEYDKAARLIFRKTISLAQHLRPKALWGFYGFPYCNYDAGNNSEVVCSAGYQKHNDDMKFVMDISDAIFPSIYLNHKRDWNYNYVQAILTESERWAKMYSPSKPVYAFTKFEYDPYEIKSKNFYKKKDLCASMKAAADSGVQGLLLWSSSKDMKHRCDSIHNVVKDKIGPTAYLIQQRVAKCNKDRCSGNGRCIRSKRAKVCTFRFNKDEYKCDCLPGFYGDKCEKKKVRRKGISWRKLTTHRYHHPRRTATTTVVPPTPAATIWYDEPPPNYEETQFVTLPPNWAADSVTSVPLWVEPDSVAWTEPELVEMKDEKWPGPATPAPSDEPKYVNTPNYLLDNFV